MARPPQLGIEATLDATDQTLAAPSSSAGPRRRARFVTDLGDGYLAISPDGARVVVTGSGGFALQPSFLFGAGDAIVAAARDPSCP